MIGRLKRRFVLLSMVCLLLLMSVVVTVMNAINYTSTVADIDEILTLLSQNHGTFPGIFEHPTDELQPERPSEPDTPRLPGHMSPELPYETRYFSVVLDGDGNVLFTDLSRIAAVDEATAAVYATQCLNGGQGRGFAGSYRYVRSEEVGTVRFTFLDCGRKLAPVRAFLTTSILISLAGLTMAFFILVFFAGRIVRPIAESYEKQKRFITDAGHEIKTPLTVIRANVDILEMEHGPSESLADIRQQAERLTALTHDLTYLARMEENERSPIMIDFPLSDVVQEVALPFRTLAQAAGKEIQFRIHPLLTLRGSDTDIRRLISLLMDNALKYSKAESTIVLHLHKQGSSVLLEIANETEAPLSAEQLNHVFDRFYRADASRNSNTGGYGIGLSTAKAIVEAHGGRITATSADNAVFKVTVTFP